MQFLLALLAIIIALSLVLPSEGNERYSKGNVQQYGTWDLDLLAHPPVPKRWEGHASRFCGAYTAICWHALMDAGLGPLAPPPVGFVTPSGATYYHWLHFLSLTLKNESWLRWDCVGLDLQGYS